MNVPPIRPTGSALVILLGSLVLAGCPSGTRMGSMEVRSTPPDLRYIPKERVRETMWTLAAEIETLERLLRENASDPANAQRPAVRDSLARMRRAATRIDQPGRTSQHPLLDRNLTAFVARIERAQRAVERDPPNYYLAGTVSGACFACHGPLDD